MSESDFWPLLTVVLLESLTLAVLGLSGGTIGALLSGEGVQALKDSAVIGAVVVPFLTSFFVRLKRRMPALRDAVGLDPLNGNEG